MPAKKEKTETAENKKESTFVCKFCEQTKPLSEMVVISRFFPAVPACRECGKKLR